MRSTVKVGYGWVCTRDQQSQHGALFTDGCEEIFIDRAAEARHEPRTPSAEAGPPKRADGIALTDRFACR
jgi:hypothetical protein